MPGTGCPAMTALAWVVRSFGAYFEFDRKVMCPGPASSIPRTPTRSTSGSPVVSQPSVAASSLSFMANQQSNSVDRTPELLLENEVQDLGTRDRLAVLARRLEPPEPRGRHRAGRKILIEPRVLPGHGCG